VVGHFAHRCLCLTGAENHNSFSFEKTPAIVGTVAICKALRFEADLVLSTIKSEVGHENVVL